MKTAAAAAVLARQKKDLHSSYSSDSSTSIDRFERNTLPYQKAVRDFYLLPRIQILVAVIIFLNFITAAAQAEMLSDSDSNSSQIFDAFEYFYVYVFLIELVVNIYGHWFTPFWRSGWNWFDFIIVVVSLLSLYFPDLPAISVLRLFRAFRVFRLFKRVKEMRKIIEGVMRSLLALSWAFLCMGLIMGIWGTMGVDLFKDIKSEYVDGEGTKHISGYYFGNFFRAILSLGQIMTFDSWSSGIARDIIIVKGAVAAIYFSTFVFVGAIIMMNVLVALLLDNYLSPSDDSDDEDTSWQLQQTQSIFLQLVRWLTRTEIDLGEFSKYLYLNTFKNYEKYTKNKQTTDKCPGAFDSELAIGNALLNIEKQLIKLRRSELQIFDPAIIGNFSFKEKIIKEKVWILPYQKNVKRFYSLRLVQLIVAGMIFLNFISSAAYVQVLPKSDSQSDKIFRALEYTYVYFFLMELLINWYGSFFCEFWHNGWNIFDFFVVSVSFVATIYPDIPAFNVLRLFRAFRVARLFKRVEGMKVILERIMNSLPALSYAFVAMALITGIWAIMGVDFFSEMVHKHSEDNEDQRGYYFGSFFKAFLSLSQITTFDSWCSGIARDVILKKGIGAAFYFVTYIFFSSIIMMNVLVALFLDNYLTPLEEKDETELTAEEAMGQLSAYVKEKDLDLSDFSDYLRENAFPDFILRYHNIKKSEYWSAEEENSSILENAGEKLSHLGDGVEVELVTKTRIPTSSGLSVYLDMGDANSSLMFDGENEPLQQEKSDKPEFKASTVSLASGDGFCSSDESNYSV